jgi:hypothetical protein
MLILRGRGQPVDYAIKIHENLRKPGDIHAAQEVLVLRGEKAV